MTTTRAGLRPPGADDVSPNGSDAFDESDGRAAVGSNPEDDPKVAEQELEETFVRSIDEGRRRLARKPWPLLATGVLGGIDVGTGVLALLVVKDATESVLLAGLAFTIGFIALTLAKSELFTEDFLVPVTTVIARQARFRMLLRLWSVTLLANLAGGWVFTYVLMVGFSELADTAIKAGGHYIDLGLGWRAFCLAVIGGAVITLMTWMQHSPAHRTGTVRLPGLGGDLGARGRRQPGRGALLTRRSRELTAEQAPGDGRPLTTGQAGTRSKCSVSSSPA